MRSFFLEDETFTTEEYRNSKKKYGSFQYKFSKLKQFSWYWPTSLWTCWFPRWEEEPWGTDSVQFEKKLVVAPEWNKIEDDGDYEDDNKGKPGEEGNAEVEHVFDALENVG